MACGKITKNCRIKIVLSTNAYYTSLKRLNYKKRVSVEDLIYHALSLQPKGDLPSD